MSVGIVASDCDCSDKPKNGGVSVPGKSRNMVKVYLFRRHAVQCIGSFCVALLRQVTTQLIISIIIIVSSFAARVAGNKWLKERCSTFRVSQTAPWRSTCGDFHLLPQVSSPRNLAANVI